MKVWCTWSQLAIGVRLVMWILEARLSEPTSRGTRGIHQETGEGREHMSLATGRWRYCQACRVMTDARSVHCFKGTEDSPCEEESMAARREGGADGRTDGMRSRMNRR